jgi:hypothetical protein
MKKDYEEVAVDYHSALKSKKTIDLEPLHFWRCNGNYAFIHDIRKPLPPVYAFCDVIYSEPAWSRGLKEFAKRVGAKPMKITEYAGYINLIISSCKKDVPVFLVVSKADIKYYRTPDRVINIKFSVHNNMDTLLLVYNYCGEILDGISQYTLIDQLAQEFNKVGDFNCGYGLTGKIFNANKKNFVMSDFNGKCIRYISKLFEEK